MVFDLTPLTAMFWPGWTVFVTYSLACIVLTLTPGPDMTLFLGQTISSGRRAGFGSMAGASTGLVVHTILAAIGLSALIAASPSAFNVLKVVGALYLAWLAYQALRHGSALTLDDNKPRVPTGFRKAFGTGLMINLLNPKIIVFFVTFLPQFVQASDPHAGSKITFLGLWFIVLAAPFAAAMILTADRIALRLKQSQRATRLFDWAFASVMGAFAVKLLLTQTR